MNTSERASSISAAGAVAGRSSSQFEEMAAAGKFYCECRDKDGNLKWVDEFDNLITDEGKKYMLDCALGGQTLTSAYMGLISSVGYGTGPAAGDTAAQINGTNSWKEAGSSTNFPLIANRGTPSFSAAAKNTNVDKATSSAVSFSIITTGGTVKGAIIVINGTSAVANTTGKLFSAGLFTGGDKIVAVSDTLNVSYTASLT